MFPVSGWVEVQSWDGWLGRGRNMFVSDLWGWRVHGRDWQWDSALTWALASLSLPSVSHKRGSPSTQEHGPPSYNYFVAVSCPFPSCEPVIRVKTDNRIVKALNLKKCELLNKAIVCVFCVSGSVLLYCRGSGADGVGRPEIIWWHLVGRVSVNWDNECWGAAQSWLLMLLHDLPSDLYTKVMVNPLHYYYCIYCRGLHNCAEMIGFNCR